jgi:hypothetical protein
MLDMGGPTFTCEACGREDIRYVHLLEHDESAPISVGCECAGKLQDDYATARRRRTAIVGRAGRLRRWVKGRWRRWDDGVRYRRTDGRLAKIVPVNGGWKSMYRDTEHDWWTCMRPDDTPCVFPTAMDAKRSLFEELYPLSAIAKLGTDDEPKDDDEDEEDE